MGETSSCSALHVCLQLPSVSTSLCLHVFYSTAPYRNFSSPNKNLRSVSTILHRGSFQDERCHHPIHPTAVDWYDLDHDRAPKPMLTVNVGKDMRSASFSAF